MKDNQDAFQRFNAQWTPTILVTDQRGTEHHRIEGFLPKEDFLAQLRMGLAHAARARGDFSAAEQLYGELASSGSADLAAESTYWGGVSKYKRTNDPSALGETATRIREAYPDSTWAKKSSVWG